MRWHAPKRDTLIQMFPQDFSAVFATSCSELTTACAWCGQAMEKQLWTLRAAYHTQHKAGLSTAPENNEHVTEYVEHAERVLAEMRRDEPDGVFRLPKL